MSRQLKPIIHARDHLPGGADPIPGLSDLMGGVSWYDGISDIAELRDLRGYWRLGDAAAPYADTHEDYYLGSSPYADAPATKETTGAAMTADYTTGALPTADDDGAVAFNGNGTTAGDYLNGSGSEPGRFNFAASTDDLTVIAWIKPFTDADDFSGGIAGSMAEGVSTPAGWGLHFHWPEQTVTFTRRQLNSVTTTVTGAGVPFDEWTLVVATYSDTNGCRLYLDGALVDTDAATHMLGASFNFGVWIGWGIDPATGDDNHFYGAIDEVSVWGSELTDSEISTLHSYGTGTGSGGATGPPGPEGPTGPEGPEGPPGPGSEPADDTQVWMPLTTVTGGVPELVWDADDSLIPTLTPV